MVLTCRAKSCTSTWTRSTLPLPARRRMKRGKSACVPRCPPFVPENSVRTPLRSPSLPIGAWCGREPSRARSADTIHLSGRYVRTRRAAHEIEPMVRRFGELTWAASCDERRIARTVVLKLKTAEFKILTRSHTALSPPSSCEELTAIVLSLRERVALGPQQRFRLVGVGVSNFLDPKDNNGAVPWVRVLVDGKQRELDPCCATKSTALGARRCEMRSAMPGRRRSKRRLHTAILSFVCT